MTTNELRNFWNNLEDARSFDNHYSTELAGIEATKERIAKLKKQLAFSENVLLDAENMLEVTVMRQAAKDWTSKEIELAKR